MDIEQNKRCYNFEKITYDSGLLDETVDCTYVIHLENNGRKQRVYDELSRIQPTKQVFIVLNKGFKKCQKKLLEQKSHQDLTDAFLQCFRHAREHGYGNIMILEDDFIFNDEIKNEVHIKNINRFIESNKDSAFMYYIGIIPIISIPTSDLNTYRSIKGLTAHSVIYSKKCIEKMDEFELDYKHWDVIMEQNIADRYFYYKPLCYQTFPETENKKSWHEKDKSIYVGKIKNFIITLLNMNNEPEPGFTTLYYISKMIILVISIILLFMVVFLIYYIYRRQKTFIKRVLKTVK